MTAFADDKYQLLRQFRIQHRLQVPLPPMLLRRALTTRLLLISKSLRIRNRKLLKPPDKFLFKSVLIYVHRQGNTASIGDSISVNCKDCSVDGSIEITEGEFTVMDSVTAAFQAKDFITNGYFKAVFNGVKAHVELDTTLSLSTGIQFDQTLTTIGLPGFQVC
jgi:hypothetical protein